MRTVFADTPYWIAMLNPEDECAPLALAASRELGNARLVTTQEVLAEVMNYFARYGPAVRGAAAEAVREILTASNVTVVAQSPESFVGGLDLYDGDSAGATDLTGSIAMNIMREEGIDEVLTTDPAFSRAGFRVLMG